MAEQNIPVTTEAAQCDALLRQNIMRMLDGYDALLEVITAQLGGVPHQQLMNVNPAYGILSSIVSSLTVMLDNTSGEQDARTETVLKNVEQYLTLAKAEVEAAPTAPTLVKGGNETRH